VGDCFVVGEECVDPDGPGAAAMRCMGGAGTQENPYFTQTYRWALHLYDMELYPGTFDFDAFDFADRVRYLTHESSNEEFFY
jgi:hypothetical protein